MKLATAIFGRGHRMQQVRLYYSAASCSLAPHIVLEEIGQPYEAVRVDTLGGENKQPEYLRINPKARVPAITIGQWSLTENPAILQYLGRRHPEARLWPADLEDQARCQEWLAWIASTVHVAYAHIRRAERYADSPAGMEEVRAVGRKSTFDVYQQIEAKLVAGTWGLGGADYTVLDPYLLVFWMWGRGPVAGFDMVGAFPKWTRHARAMAERPAVRRVLAREDSQPPA
jgi:glutathione S-transferase